MPHLLAYATYAFYCNLSFEGYLVVCGCKQVQLILIYRVYR